MGFGALGRDERRQVRALHKRAKAAGVKAGIVDRNAVWPLKLAALRLIHAAGMRPARRIAYDDFRRREGAGLHNFAVWSAMVSPSSVFVNEGVAQVFVTTLMGRTGIAVPGA